MKTRPRKRFGQHWLESKAALNQMLTAARLAPSDRVLEIGPGKGVLTEKLLSQAEEVVSVEIDRDLCVYLRRHFHQHPRFHLLEADFLKTPFAGDDALPVLQTVNKVVANIPYNITGPILDKLLGTVEHPFPRPLDAIVLLLQREVADRICAQPGSKRFGALSVRSQYLAKCELLYEVPAKAFKPAPKVESAIICLTPRPYPAQATNPKWMGTLVKQGFSTRRKMLRNNLAAIVDRETILPSLESVDASLEARAEELSLNQWVQLSDILRPKSQGEPNHPQG
ncbi:MAG: 16S rRNA (adenine(1518)-N(6)/adenine(1519)-N(6))-dimethyltransferase RsmA [Cyanobacteria bacterium P01_F01_bin.42]